MQQPENNPLMQRLPINLSDRDRFIRLMAGAVLVMVAWLFGYQMAFWAGMFLILTAAFHFCPIYALLNIRTLGTERSRTIIPWEEFLSMWPPVVAKPAAQAVQVAVVEDQATEPEPEVFKLPTELTHALIGDIEKNALDEMLVIRFFENIFGCSITIQPSGHLHSYVCKFSDKSVSMDFAKLKSTLLDRLREDAE